MHRPSPQRQRQQQQRLSNELHDEAFDISSSNGTTPMDTPQGYLASHMMMNNNNNNRIPRPSSPTPTSSDYTTETETETETEGEHEYHHHQHHHQSTRPASPPSKQPSVPRAHSSRPAPDFVSPSGARQALEELDESMDQLCDKFPDTASSTVNSALNEVCDKLELLSEIVLSHERRLKSAEQQHQQVAPSPFAQPVHDGVSSPGYVHQAESNRALVNSILSKVDAVEAMMQQHVSSSPQQQQQQQSVRSPLAPLSSPADLKMTMAAMNNSNQENITPARSEASQVIAATVESAMKSISRQLAKQNELLAQVVVSSAAASQQRRGPSPSSAYQQTPYGSDENEDPLAQSTTASIADECSPQGAELSPRRERTPEALKVTQQESAQRQREARHVDPSNVVPPARLYEEYAYSGTEEESETESDYITETDETEQEEESNISVNNIQEDDGAYYYDRIHQQKKLHENSYNVPFVGAGADIVSVTSSQFEEEVADEDEVDNASPRRAMYGAVDSVATIRAMSTSPARNRGTIQAPVAVVFESDDDETETETETEDEEEDLHQQPSIACTDTEDDEEQIRVAEHFSPSRRTPQAYRTTEAEVARRDEEELVATLRAKQETQAYLEEAIMRSSERRRREQHHQSSASSSPASRASTASRHQQEEDDDHPSTGRHPNESLLVEVEGLTPQPAYLLRSAIRNDAESAEKLPEKRALFTEDIEEDDNESEMTQEEDFVSVQKTSTNATPSDMSYASEAPSNNNNNNNNNRVSNIYETLVMQQQQQQQQPASETSSVFSQQSATTIPNDLLQTVIDELHRLRNENASLKNQLDWALKRTDAVSERLLELSPCK